jgi:hypothetical protein
MFNKKFHPSFFSVIFSGEHSSQNCTISTTLAALLLTPRRLGAAAASTKLHAGD